MSPRSGRRSRSRSPFRRSWPARGDRSRLRSIGDELVVDENGDFAGEAVAADFDAGLAGVAEADGVAIDLHPLDDGPPSSFTEVRKSIRWVEKIWIT